MSYRLAERRRARHRSRRPGPSQRYFDGNLLVQQVRSEIGCEDAQLETLRTLKLGRIGRSATCDASDGSVRAELENVDFLVAVEPLTLDAVWLCDVRVDSELTTSTVRSAAGVSRQSFVAGDTGYAYHERHDDELVVAWSSALPAATALCRVKRLGWTPGEAESVVVDPHRPHKLSGIEGWTRVVAGPSAAAFVRIDFREGTLVWAPAVYPRHVEHGYLPGRIGIRSTASRLEADTLEQLIVATGTPEIALHAPRIADAATND